MCFLLGWRSATPSAMEVGFLLAVDLVTEEHVSPSLVGDDHGNEGRVTPSMISRISGLDEPLCAVRL